MIIKNIRLIDPANSIDDICNIVIENSIIKAVTKACDSISLDESNDKIIIDGNGLIATPGFVDVHIHFRDPGQTHKEDIHTGSQSAAAGGYTSVVMMANTSPTIDCEEVLADVLGRGLKEKINIYSCVNATKGMQGKEVVDPLPLKAIGAVGITDDGKPILDEAVFKAVCENAVKADLPLSLHEEDPKYISENGVNSGSAAEGLGLKGSDRQAEISIIERDLEIASKLGVTLSIQHISTKEGVELVRKAKETNPLIHAEATPHHFSLTDEAVAVHGTLAKMNPPLRKEEDMLAIRAGLADGTIDMIATDHAPHSVEEKAQEFTKAPSGIIGLETALSLAIMNLIDTKVLDYTKLIEVMSLNPARLYNLPAGNLSIGQSADIVIFNPSEEYIAGNFKSKSSNSPFTGQKLKGKVKYTICRGEIVYSDIEKQ